MADPTGTTKLNGVTPKQELAIVALLTESTISKAAKSANIPEGTMRRWLAQGPFKRAYREARREAFSQAISLTQKYAPMAVHALAKILSDEQSPAGARVQAAVAVLKFTRESIELDEMVERIERLEQLAAQQESEPWRLDHPAA
jgi:hypothetical protein